MHAIDMLTLEDARSEASDRAPRDPVSLALVRAVVEVAKLRNVSSAALLGADESLLFEEPAERWVSRGRLQALLSRAVELTQDPAFGLRCGWEPNPSSFGLMAPLIGHSPSLRRALELVSQFQHLIVAGLRVELRERAGVAQLRCELSGKSAGERAFAEMILAGLARAVWTLGCARQEVLSVHVPFARPAHYYAYSQVFGGAERFAQDCAGIDFVAAALDRPHLHRHAELQGVLLVQAERTLKQIWQPLSCLQRARALLRGRSCGELPDMVEAARALGLSVRSLRRHLDEEGTSFRALTQEVLRESACTMLRNPALSLQSIAHELGFSDVTAFHRAFRRWAGSTPLDYRNAHAYSQ